MFNRPIAYTPLKSIEEILEVSIQLPCDASALPRAMEWNQNSGWMTFIDARGFQYLTPVRPETDRLMKEAGYRWNDSIYVPGIDTEDARFRVAKWLWKDARAEWWAYTYQEAKKVADKKGIKEVEITESVRVREINWDQMGYRAMVDMYLANGTSKNVGTYIIVDDKTLLVCDEHGRTFMIAVHKVVNDIVNSLIESGYTKTVHPWWYVEDKRENNPKRKIVNADTMDEIPEDTTEA